MLDTKKIAQNVEQPHSRDDYNKIIPYIPIDTEIDEKENNLSHDTRFISFPSSLFPKMICDFIEETAKSLQCPNDFIGISALAVISTAIGNSRVIEAKSSWKESATLYCAIVAEPGSKKTPAISKAVSPLWRIQQQYTKEYKDKLENYNLELANYEKEIMEWKKSKAKNPEHVPVKPTKPIYPQIIVGDSTMEALQDQLQQNQKGIIMVSDELISWVKSMNQYRSGSDRQCWLSMWSNSPIIINRKTKDEPTVILKPHCNILGGIQPDVLIDLIQDGKNDGLPDRFLFTFPNSVHAKWDEVELSESVMENYSQIIEALHFDQYKENEPKIIKFSDAAKKNFINWYDDLIDQIRCPYLPTHLQGYLSKMPGMCLRIILTLHTVKWICKETDSELLVDETTVTATTYLVNDYLIPHGKKVFNFVYGDKQTKLLLKCMDYIKRKGKKVDGGLFITLRALHQAKICGSNTKSGDIFHLAKLMQNERLGEIITRQSSNNKKSHSFLLYDKNA
ncbi:DUF3987 domain-containing protein [Priestia megaterium]|uniref:YfjI family protein n=1 Tax=Priestia megaterium TaxID=1404 RepID=UPI0010AB71A3|nr:YfjI family protein [Priestia megaterium]TJZ40064.1 DUF3987 domain-containing protein [Priestia megaterium]